MRDESVEPKQQAATKDRDAVIETLAQAGRTDGHRAVGEPSDHDGVHDAHAHPSDFGDDEGQSQAECQDKVRPQDLGRGLVECRGHVSIVNISTRERLDIRMPGISNSRTLCVAIQEYEYCCRSEE